MEAAVVQRALSVLSAAQQSAGGDEARRLAAALQEEARAGGGRGRGGCGRLRRTLWGGLTRASPPTPSTPQLKTCEPRLAAGAAAALSGAGQPLEARLFGLAVLRHCAKHRWAAFSPDERSALARLALERLREGAFAAGRPERERASLLPLSLSHTPSSGRRRRHRAVGGEGADGRVACRGAPAGRLTRPASRRRSPRSPRHLAAARSPRQAVRSDGVALWVSLCPELVAGAGAGPGHAEATCLVLTVRAPGRRPTRAPAALASHTRSAA